MMFEETEDGMTVYITHEEMTSKGIIGFILTFLHGREIYLRHHDADMDVDNPKED